MNLINIFYQQVEQQPQHPLILGPAEQQSYSYLEFAQHIQSLVAQLQGVGVAKGHCVGLHYPSDAQYIALTYAIWGCGACVVPIPVELTPEEKQVMFTHIRIDTVISKTTLAAQLTPLHMSVSTPLSEEIVFTPISPLREHPPGFTQINAAFIRFTSGTTGEAKGVVLSHETIYERIRAANQSLHLGPSDRILWLLSMAYHFAVSIVAYLSSGATIIFCPNHFGITMTRTAAKHRATIIYGAPTHYQLMSHDRGQELLPDLRLAIVTTTSLRETVAAAFYHRFQKPLNETYGIIEIGLPCINVDQPRAKQGSVGRLLPAYEMRLEKLGTEDHLRAIHLRGAGLLDAYYEPWNTREEILQSQQGWFVTGDLGHVDEEGYLYIRGRSKEIINVGGMKFFPQEVEAVLETHPAIKEACVSSHSDKRLGELPYAQLVKQAEYPTLPTVEELRDFCAHRLAMYKIPEQFQWVERLVRTASGKLIRDTSKRL